MLFCAIHAILQWGNLQSLLSISLLLGSLISYPCDRQMISYKHIWSLDPLLTDVRISREVSPGCLQIQMACEIQVHLTLSLSCYVCHSPCSLSLPQRHTPLRTWNPLSEHVLFSLPPHLSLWLLPINQFIPVAITDIIFKSCSPDVTCSGFTP